VGWQAVEHRAGASLSEKLLAEDTDPAAVASLFVTLMPGLIVMSHLYELPTESVLTAGVLDFAAATSAARHSSPVR
jgi:hypothetical protein